MAVTTARKAYEREYYVKNRERLLERNKLWVEQNYPKVKARKAIHNRKRVYGLSEEEYQGLLVRQNNSCAICLSALSKPCVDHNHQTGVVRGLLCDKCNRGLGYFNDSPTALMAAADYLERN